MGAEKAAQQEAAMRAPPDSGRVPRAAQPAPVRPGSQASVPQVQEVQEVQQERVLPVRLLPVPCRR